MTLAPPAPVGAQRPRLLTAPPASSSAGREAVELARRAELLLDPWQEFALDQSLAERADGQWASFEVGLIVSRQNGKGALLEARELAGIALFGEKLITHTAHEFATSLEAFQRVLVDIESCPDLDSLVRRVSRAHGEEGIELRNGARLRFRARTHRAGRGFSGDVVVLDEAMYLPPAAISALMPTMSTRPNPQMWYVGSPPDAAEHENCHALAALRRRAQGADAGALCWLEWSPDYEHPDDVAHLCDVHRTPQGDPELEAAIAAANPGLGIRITREYVENERRSMLPRAWAVERLGVGAWPKAEGADKVIDPELWASICDPDSQALDPVAFAIDVTPDRSRASIGTVGWRADGRVHGEVVDDRAGTGWLIPRLLELVARWDPCALVVDAGSPAASLLPDIEEQGLEAEVTTTRAYANACGGFYDDATQDRFRYVDPTGVLSAAVDGAGQRPLGDAWAWDRRSTTPITPLVAVTLARWGLVLRGRIAPPPPPQGLPTEEAGGSAAGGVTDDLTTVGF